MTRRSDQFRSRGASLRDSCSQATMMSFLLLLPLVNHVDAFMTPSRYRRPIAPKTRTAAAVDPQSLSEAVLSGLDHLSQLNNIQQLDASAAQHDRHFVESILSTMYTSDGIFLGPAQGHSNPMFGPPDPLLEAGKSIAPTSSAGQAIVDLGPAPATPQLSEASAELAARTSAAADKAVSQGWKLLDSAGIRSESVLPGFQPTGGILPQHNPRVLGAEESPESFAAQVEWGARFINVVDKIPYLAFAYGLIDFFLLRSGVDVYKEDIEDDPSEALADAVAATTVRVGIFLIIAIVTVTLFG